MKKKLLILLSGIASLFTLVSKCNIKTDSINESIESARLIELESKLDSYSLEKKKNGITIFTGEANLSKFYLTNKLKTNQAVRKGSQKVEVEVETIAPIGLVTADLKVKSTGVDIIEHEEKIYGYTAITEDAAKDVVWDMYDNSIASSEILEKLTVGDSNTESQSAVNNNININHNLVLDDYYDTDVMRYLAAISIELCVFSDAQTLANELMKDKIPELDYKNPAPYVFYQLKIEMVKQHFEHNCSLDLSSLEKEFNGTKYIENQKHLSFNDWQFGFGTADFGKVSHPSIKNSGCEIISVWNALQALRIKPENYQNYFDGSRIRNELNFASLISLFELCGADLVSGYFGINPIPKDSIACDNWKKCLDMVVVALTVQYDTIFRPLLDTILTFLDTSIFLNPTTVSLTAGLSTAASGILHSLVAEGPNFLAAFIEWYVDYFQNSIYEVLKLVFGNTYVKSISTIQAFKELLEIHEYAIVTYWNVLNDDKTVNYFEGAHSIFIKKEFNNQFYSFNNYECIAYRSPLEIEKFFGDYDSGNGWNEKQFIWGYTIF